LADLEFAKLYRGPNGSIHLTDDLIDEFGQGREPAVEDVETALEAFEGKVRALDLENRTILEQSEALTAFEVEAFPDARAELLEALQDELAAILGQEEGGELFRSVWESLYLGAEDTTRFEIEYLGDGKFRLSEFTNSLPDAPAHATTVFYNGVIPISHRYHHLFEFVEE